MRRVILFLGLSLLVGMLFVAAGFFGLGTPGRPVRASVRPPLGLITDTPTTLPSATPTPTLASTATASATPPPAVTTTPTVCLVIFNDVPSDNTFYADIECLACRGIVGGYPCGGPGEPCPGQYYRPGNNVTRGQASKIVSSAAQFADPVPSTQQTFEDVPPGSTFWSYIELLVGRGIISGYPCGGAGEPCIAPANRPYFRPNNNVTRGQLSKIVSGAAGYQETPTGQAFVDIPPSHPFYLYVERIAARGTISGYPCGGAGEPCPGVYFRPGNNATRGQMAKIAAQTFYPNCPTCALRWRVVPSANPATSTNQLLGVAVMSANDVWAVGNHDAGGGNSQTLVEHWNGTNWSEIPSPNPGTLGNGLQGVAAVSASDAWAVGYYRDSNAIQTLVERWNGSSWSVVSSPNAGSSSAELWSVAAVQADDVWAVGDYWDGTARQTLVEHWNGSSWNVVPSPNLGMQTNELLSVAVVSANDVWAVGYAESGITEWALIEHWDGTQWQIVPSPNIVSNGVVLHSVAAVSANDVWAVGQSGIATLVEHWNGTSWSIVPSPNGGSSGNSLRSVAVVNANDVWAVGVYTLNSGDQTLIEHWNGTRWNLVPAPNTGTSAALLQGLAAVSANDVWAVGYDYSSGSPEHTLVEHYTLTCP